MYACKIGSLHKDFFDVCPLFKAMSRKTTENGVQLSTPFLSLRYNDGLLYADDIDVLSDFALIIKNEYGTKVTRQQIKDSIDWKTVRKKYNILNIGVVELPDSYNGWDGTINAIWYDDEIPGNVVNIYYQFWHDQFILGSYTLKLDDIKDNASAAMPNLLKASKILQNEKKKIVDDLLLDLAIYV